MLGNVSGFASSIRSKLKGDVAGKFGPVSLRWAGFKLPGAMKVRGGMARLAWVINNPNDVSESDRGQRKRKQTDYSEFKIASVCMNILQE